MSKMAFERRRRHQGSPKPIWPQLAQLSGLQFGAKIVKIQENEFFECFFSVPLFYSTFGSPWPLHGRGTYAIRTRRRVRNAYFTISDSNRKSLPNASQSVSFWSPFWSNIPHFSIFWSYQKRAKKKRDPKVKSQAMAVGVAPRRNPPFARGNRNIT